jgi:hypothetical protein
MVNEWHIVGNHKYSHPDMSKISDMVSFKNEMTNYNKDKNIEKIVYYIFFYFN